jgi:hypothetical protein
MVAVLAVSMATAPAAAAQPCTGTDDLDTYPLGQGTYATAGDVGWIYFKTAAGQACGIGPDGVIGCDNVPPDTPKGANQTIAGSSEAAVYRHSEVSTFTRDVDILPEGHRLENGQARCAVGYQGTVHCQTPGGSGGHGFTIAGAYGLLW